MERPRQHLSRLGERPRRSIDVAVGGEDVEDAIELLAQRQVLAAHPPLQIGDLPLDSVRLSGGGDLCPQVGIARHRVLVRTRTRWCSTSTFRTRRRVELDCTESMRHVVAVLLAVRGAVGRQRDGPHGIRRLVEVLGHRMDALGRFRDEGGPQAALSVRCGDHCGCSSIGALGNVDDSPRSESSEGLGHCSPLLVASGGISARLLFAESSVFVEVPVIARCLSTKIGDGRASAFESGLETNDVTVRLVLGEGEIQQVVCLFAAVGPNEVRRHVVGRMERRAQVERRAACELRDLVEPDPR